MTILRSSLAPLHVSSSRRESWNAKQITCCTSDTIFSLHNLDIVSQRAHAPRHVRLASLLRCG